LYSQKTGRKIRDASDQNQQDAHNGKDPRKDTVKIFHVLLIF